MTITAKVICDSISPQGIRLTTMELRYPKFIHGEFMTHRVFSRNASSSRAIPVERLIQDVMDDPAMPVFWGKNKPGMQAVEEMNDDERKTAEEIWLLQRDEAVAQARCLAELGAHKQIVNRLIEPWCHIRVVVTSTEWANFFALRCHPAAQPEMRILAEKMRDAMNLSIPTLCKTDGWHLPYYDPKVDGEALFDADLGGNPFSWMIRLSVARCARVSYKTHEGKPPNVEEDLKLYDRLVGAEPLHASPAEHQATPIPPGAGTWDSYLCGNFVGWMQYRKMLANESVKDR